MANYPFLYDSPVGEPPAPEGAAHRVENYRPRTMCRLPVGAEIGVRCDAGRLSCRRRVRLRGMFRGVCKTDALRRTGLPIQRRFINGIILVRKKGGMGKISGAPNEFRGSGPRERDRPRRVDDVLETMPGRPTRR